MIDLQEHQNNSETINVDLDPGDQHERVIVIFQDPSLDNQQMGFTILWLLLNGLPHNIETDTPLQYVSTQLIH